MCDVADCYLRSDGAVRYFRGRCFFQSLIFDSLQVLHYEVFVWGVIYSKVLNHTAYLGYRAISKQLKTITSAASSMKTALHNVSWVLYLASRQNFIWSQYCNIILIHYVMVYCQSAAFITKQNKTRSGFWYCHLLLAAWTEKTPLLISPSAVCDAAIGHGECKLLPKRQAVIYFSGLLYYLCLIKYPDFIMSHLKGSWDLQVCKNLNIILKKKKKTNQKKNPQSSNKQTKIHHWCWKPLMFSGRKLQMCVISVFHGQDKLRSEGIDSQSDNAGGLCYVLSYQTRCLQGVW